MSAPSTPAGQPLSTQAQDSVRITRAQAVGIATFLHDHPAVVGHAPLWYHLDEEQQDIILGRLSSALLSQGVHVGS